MLTTPDIGLKLKPTEKEREDLVRLRLSNLLDDIRLGEQQRLDLRNENQKLLREREYHSSTIKEMEARLASLKSSTDIAKKELVEVSVLHTTKEKEIASFNAHIAEHGVELSTRERKHSEAKKALSVKEDSLNEALRMQGKERENISNAKNAFQKAIESVVWN